MQLGLAGPTPRIAQLEFTPIKPGKVTVGWWFCTGQSLFCSLFGRLVNPIHPACGRREDSRDTTTDEHTGRGGLFVRRASKRWASGRYRVGAEAWAGSRQVCAGAASVGTSAIGANVLRRTSAIGANVLRRTSAIGANVLRRARSSGHILPSFSRGLRSWKRPSIAQPANSRSHDRSAAPHWPMMRSAS